ncbi:MAG: hypothetical protein RBS47_06690, partial [Hydrogenophaga sp.]|nr:hypothetical protein [Hydrogenophaga sp.]
MIRSFRLPAACLAAITLLLSQSVQAQPPTPPPTADNARLGWALIGDMARQRAAQPYRPAPSSLPADLARLDYDGVRDIRF